VRQAQQARVDLGRGGKALADHVQRRHALALLGHAGQVGRRQHVHGGGQARHGGLEDRHDGVLQAAEVVVLKQAHR